MFRRATATIFRCGLGADIKGKGHKIYSDDFFDKNLSSNLTRIFRKVIMLVTEVIQWCTHLRSNYQALYKVRLGNRKDRSCYYTSDLSGCSQIRLYEQHITKHIYEFLN